ncbi:MAG: 3'-5' exonuclease [Promethearchaeota archaeon]
MQKKLDEFQKYYEEMQKNKKEIAVLDIETTALYPSDGMIVEIGICKLDIDTGNIEKLFNKIVREDRPIDCNAWIFKNSDLSVEEVEKAEMLNSKNIRKEIQDILDKYPATAYNKGFDFGWLKSRGFNIKELPCPMLVAKDILKIRFENDYSYNDYKWPSVQESWDYFFPNSNYIEKHRAYDDAEHEAMIVYELYKRGSWKFQIESNPIYAK